MSDNRYVRTMDGYIHVNDIPVVIPEPFKSRSIKFGLFFVILIVITIVALYIVSINFYKNDLRTSYKNSNLLNGNFSELGPSVQEQQLSVVNAQTIEVFNRDQYIPLENIVLISADGNVIDIDIRRNYFVRTYRGTNTDGILYSVNLGSEQQVKEIILISGLNRPKTVNIDLYDTRGELVWDRVHHMENSHENSVYISKTMYKKNIETPREKLLDGRSQEITLYNDNKLALKLLENSEEYVGYQY